MPSIDKLFQCPKCGGNRLEEVMRDVVVASRIVSLDEGGDTVYGHQTHEDGKVDRYQCVDCGWEIDGVCTTERLYEELNDPGNPGAVACECQKPGHFFSGIPGILAHIENGRLAPGAKVERCDCCGRYASDKEALERLQELGFGPS